MRRLDFGISLAGAALLGVVVSNVDLSQAQTTSPNPTVTSASVTSTSALIVAYNPSRRNLRICNVSLAGVGTSVWIWPGALSPPLSDYLLPVMAAGGPPTCYTPPTGLTNGEKGYPPTNQYNANGTAVLSVEEW